MVTTYEEALDRLYTHPAFQQIGSKAYKPGPKTAAALAEKFACPHTKYPCIHIGGTNGKGSTASTIAAILTAAGYRTGLYTSPHLLDFRERIRIDGHMISHDGVVDFINRYLFIGTELPEPSFFELTTIMAFDWFARNNVDVAVIEVGLGGRLDSTNIITPIVSVITNISLDHTAILGNSEAAIAGEKAGIIKAGVPVVIGKAEGDVFDVFKTKAAAEGSILVLASEQKGYATAKIVGTGIEYRGTAWGDFRGELCGECQLENTATVLAALPFVIDRFPAIDSMAVARGFAEVRNLSGLAGRWEELAHSPIQIICDTGHNIGGWRLSGPALQKISSHNRLHMVVGFVNDKDIDAIMTQMPSDAVYYFATPSVPRGRDSRSTCAAAAAHGLSGKAFATVEEAFAAAKDAAEEGDTIFVGGSTFVVADLLALNLHL